MKQLLFALFVIGLLPVANSQDSSFPGSKKVMFEWGRVFKDKENVTVSDIIGVDKQSIFVLTSKSTWFSVGASKPYELARFNQSLTQSKSVKLELKEGKNNKDYENIVHLNNKLFLLSSFENKELEKKFLFVQTINKESLLPNDDIRKIAEIDLSGTRSSRSDSFIIEFSPDSSTVLVYHNTPDRNYSDESYRVYVFDKDFNELWNKHIILPYKDELFERKDMEIVNGGDVFVMGYLFKENNENQRKEVNYKYLLFEYSNKGQNDYEYEIDLEEKFVDVLKLQVTDKNELVSGGFYATEAKEGIRGSFVVKIDRNNKIIKSKHTQEFGLDVYKQGLTDKGKKKIDIEAQEGKEHDLESYELRELILNKDGGIVLIGEQYYATTEIYRTSSGGGGQVDKYFYLDIIAVSVSPEGRTEWTTIVPKRQVTVNDYGHFSSYFYSVVDDKIDIIFNGTVNNLDEPEGAKVYAKSTGGGLLVLAEIDRNGNLTRKPLLHGRAAGVIIRPKVFQQISDEIFLLFAENEKDKCFVRVYFR